MKRGLGVFVLLSFILILSLTFVSAGLFSDVIKNMGKNIGKMTGAATDVDTTPRVAFWVGKVNQHTENGVWMTDPDGKSGTKIGEELAYCQKWYPNTISVQKYKLEKITTWRTAGNVGKIATSARWSYECVQKSSSVCGDGICGSGEECASCGEDCGHCIARCETDSDCHGGESCLGGVCVEVSCTENDGGIEYNVKGDVTGKIGNSFSIFIDFCENSAILNESYCDGANPKTLSHDCGIENRACSNGACIGIPTVIICTDNDSTLKNIQTLDVQTNDPSVYVKSVGTGIYIGSPDNSIYGLEPNPLEAKPSPYNYSLFYDHCSSATQLNEAFCQYNGKLSAVGLICPNGCLNGACIKAQNYTMTCADSDGGNNIYVKGTMKWNYSTSPNTQYLFIDECALGPEGTIINECDGDNCYVLENYCSGSISSKPIQDEEYLCPNGCSNGACVEEINTTSVCTDTDGGINYYIKGDSTDSTKTLIEGCINNTTTIREFYCGEDGKIYNEDYTCPNGCADGYCIQPTGRYCSVDATKCNLEWKVPVCGAVVFSGDGLKELCEVPGNHSGSVSAGFSFDNTNSCAITSLCPNECLDGVCVEVMNITNYNCTDSDGGKNYAVKGNLVDRLHNATYEDFCSGSITLREHWCGENNYQYEYYNCENGCGGGKCLKKGEKIIESVCPEQCILVNGLWVPLINELTVNLEVPDYFLSKEIKFSHLTYNSWSDYQPMLDKVGELTEGLTSDYEKAKKILDWVKHSKEYCDEGMDCISMANERRDMEDKYLYPELYEYGYGVCLDSVILSIGMLRSAGIPANQMMAGFEHIDVLFFVEGRWFVADTTFFNSPVQILDLKEEKRIFYYYDEKDFLESEAPYYFNDLPMITSFEYSSEDFADVYLPNKGVLNLDSNTQYICDFVIDMVCDNFGCIKNLYNSLNPNWRNSNNLIQYDVGDNSSYYRKPLIQGYNHFRLPSGERYKFECHKNAPDNERDGIIVSSLEFSPKKDELFVLKPIDLIKSKNATQEEYEELINLLSEKLYLEEVLKIIDNQSNLNISYEFSCDLGCPLNGKCYSFGYRKSGKYCSDNYEFVEQNINDAICENNFECASNICINNKCVDAGTWQKFLNWFKRFFGGE